MREGRPTVRIIDNKKVLLTPDEFKFFKSICEGYDRPNFKGKTLFEGHFESNNEGVIIFVSPPHKQYSSMEVFTFLISVMVNQHLRISKEQFSSMIEEGKKKYEEELVTMKSTWNKELEVLKETIKQVEQSSEQGVKDKPKKRIKKTDDNRDTSTE